MKPETYNTMLNKYLATMKKKAQLEIELEEMRVQLRKMCPHPESERGSYTWHHGYGKYVTGVTCLLCNARKSFPDSSLWSSYEEWSSRGPRFDD